MYAYLLNPRLLHSERPKLHTVLAFLSAIRLIQGYFIQKENIFVFDDQRWPLRLMPHTCVGSSSDNWEFLL